MPWCRQISACGVSVSNGSLPAFTVYDRPSPVTQLPQSIGAASNGTVVTFIVSPFIESADGVARFSTSNTTSVLAPVAVVEGGEGVISPFFPVLDTSDMPDTPGLPLSFAAAVSRFSCAYSAQELQLPAKIAANDGVYIDRLYLRVVNAPVTDTGLFQISFSQESSNFVLRNLVGVTSRHPSRTIFRWV